LCIVIDEQRCHGPFSARPCGVAQSSFVARRGAQQGLVAPARAATLSTKLLWAIRVAQGHVITL